VDAKEDAHWLLHVLNVNGERGRHHGHHEFVLTLRRLKIRCNKYTIFWLYLHVTDHSAGKHHVTRAYVEDVATYAQTVRVHASTNPEHCLTWTFPGTIATGDGHRYGEPYAHHCY
jgi:hypothetical protein